MKTIHSTSFDLVQGLDPNKIAGLAVDNRLGVLESPYKEIPLDTLSEANIEGMKMYTPEDIAFVNTAAFRKTGDYFIKHGVYTHAHPIYDKAEFDAFWDEEERRCKEGMTLPGRLIKDENGIYKMQKVHITGEHYGYLNFAEIKRSKEFNIQKGVLVNKHGEKLSKTQGGTAKTFSLPDFWDGDYYYFKALELCRIIGKHLVIGKARRKGYSYKNGWVAANRANLYPRSTTVVGAYDEDSLTDDGTMTKVQNFLDHVNKHTDWNKRRLHNTLRHIEIGYRYVGQQEKQGFLSNIYTAVFKTDPGAARGKDADLIFIEEAGKCVNLAEVLTPTLKTLSDGILTTGLMVVFGTGGGDDKYWQAFEDLFYETWAQKFITFENIWDDDMEGTGCGFFHSALMNKPGLIDKHGNSNIRGAYEFEKKERLTKQHDPVKLNDHCMEEPFSPSEAFSRAANNILPAKELDAQLRAVLRDPDYQGIGREGLFVQEPKGITFLDRKLADTFQKDLIPPQVTDYPIKATTDVRGCWVIWEPPYRDRVTGQIPKGLYRVWNDPFGISKDSENFSVKDSLGSTFIYEVPNNLTHTKGDRLVAAFHGRRENTEDYDDQLFLGTLYYDAMLLYENDRGDVYTNAKKRGLLDILVDEPEFMFQKDLQKGGKGRKKGISIAGNSNRKLNGVIYYKKWLLEKRGIQKNGKDLLNIHYIYDIGLLRESLKYTGKRNTDRLSCMIVGMFDIREQIYKEIVVEQPSRISDDDFFGEWRHSEEDFKITDGINELEI
jgi:hypothetical protein